MKKQYTKKQITEAIAYWKRQLRENSCKKINEQDDTHLPKRRVGHYETGKSKRYSVVCEAQEAAGKSVVVVDVDTVLNQDMLLNYDSSFPVKRSDRHQGGELFIEQIFIVDTREAEQLARLGLFYSNFSPKASIVDYVSQLDPCAGHSDGVVRTTQREVPEQLAQVLREITSGQPVDKVFRFVSPQAYTKNTEAFVSTNDGTVIDASKYIRVIDHGKIAALKDDSTGETLEAGSDFKHMILTQITGYWQEIDVQTMEATDLPSSGRLGDAPVAALGDRVKTISAKTQAFIQFIQNRKKFLKTSHRAQPRTYEETYALVNNLQSGYGKSVGEFKTREEALAAAREDFARWIENGWIASHPRADKAISPEDLALDQKQTGVFAPAGRYFRYAPRPGYKSSKISASWPLNKPIYTLKPIQKRVSESADRRYTKKQITEAIAYWERQLNESVQFNPRVQEILDAFANMTPEKTSRLKELAAADNLNQGAPDELDEFIDDSFWDIDRVLDDIENIDIDNSMHMNFQYNAVEIIVYAAEENYRAARKLANSYTDYLRGKSEADPELFIEGWQSHVNEPAEVLMALYNILDEKFNLRNYSVDYTAWHMDKYTVDMKARSKEEAKKKFFKDHAHEEYDMKDFEITSIKEN